MWERIFGTISAPGKTLHQAAEKELWKEGLLIVAAIAILQGLCDIATAGSEDILPYLEQFSELPLAETMQLSPAFTFFSPIIGGLLGWVILSGVFFLFAKLFKGQGTFVGMLASIGYANCPYFIGAPLAAITSLAGSFGYVLSSLIGLAVGIWVLVLSIIAIRESQHISTGAAAATYFIPIVFFVILFFLLIGALIAMTIFTFAP